MASGLDHGLEGKDNDSGLLPNSGWCIPSQTVRPTGSMEPNIRCYGICCEIPLPLWWLVSTPPLLSFDLLRKSRAMLNLMEYSFHPFAALLSLFQMIIPSRFSFFPFPLNFFNLLKGFKSQWQTTFGNQLTTFFRPIPEI